LSTGNYHPGTALAYTDIGLLTANPEIAEDVHRLFQQLSALGPLLKLRRLLQSPFTLHKALLKKIEREAAHARAGKPARIAAKVNALNESTMVQALYDAAGAGVKIELIVRGGCTLRPGVPGLSENITVRSVVGRFLEHSRVYYFENAGQPEVFCSSADWLERNLLRRIETCFPVLDPELARRVMEEGIENYLADNTNSWLLKPDGSYERLEPGEAMPHSAQSALLAKLCS
jgi:polyphosphate kinase